MTGISQRHSIHHPEPKLTLLLLLLLFLKPTPARLRLAPSHEAGIEARFAHRVAVGDPREEPLEAEAVAAVW